MSKNRRRAVASILGNSLGSFRRHLSRGHCREALIDFQFAASDVGTSECLYSGGGPVGMGAPRALGAQHRALAKARQDYARVCVRK